MSWIPPPYRMQIYMLQVQGIKIHYMSWILQKKSYVMDTKWRFSCSRYMYTVQGTLYK